MHDNNYGHVTGLGISFNDVYLFTVGADGNVFSYMLMDEEQLRKFMAEAKLLCRAEIPLPLVGHQILWVVCCSTSWVVQTVGVLSLWVVNYSSFWVVYKVGGLAQWMFYHSGWSGTVDVLSQWVVWHSGCSMTSITVSVL